MTEIKAPYGEPIRAHVVILKVDNGFVIDYSVSPDRVDILQAFKDEQTKTIVCKDWHDVSNNLKKLFKKQRKLNP